MVYVRMTNPVLIPIAEKLKKTFSSLAFGLDKKLISKGSPMLYFSPVTLEMSCSLLRHWVLSLSHLSLCTRFSK